MRQPVMVRSLGCVLSLSFLPVRAVSRLDTLSVAEVWRADMTGNATMTTP